MTGETTRTCLLVLISIIFLTMMTVGGASFLTLMQVEHMHRSFEPFNK